MTNPKLRAEVKAVFEELKQTISPDLIFTHNRTDAHQDHRLISELTWNTFRDHLILEYEIPKYDGDLGMLTRAEGPILPHMSHVNCDNGVRRVPPAPTGHYRPVPRSLRHRARPRAIPPIGTSFR